MFDRLIVIVLGYCIFAFLVIVIRYLWDSRRKPVEPCEHEDVELETLPDDKKLISDELHSEHDDEAEISEELFLSLKEEFANKKNMILLLRLQIKGLLAHCDESSEYVKYAKQKYQEAYDSLQALVPESPKTCKQLRTAIILRDSQINEIQLLIKLLKLHMEEK
ncbi:MAG TPA: hypothetical protein DCG57_02505 [Candidatus Riflebacteria bacterium]|nr:hypothetical protein [Candidatus Riflebacteria bacterium]